jgi:hypothetical protein
MFLVRGIQLDSIFETLFFSIQNSGQWPKSRNPGTPSVIDHGQKPSECKKKTG